MKLLGSYKIFTVLWQDSCLLNRSNILSLSFLSSSVLVKKLFMCKTSDQFNVNCNFTFVCHSSSRGEWAFDAGVFEASRNGSKFHYATNHYEHNVITIPPSDDEIASRKLCSIADFLPIRRSINLIEKLQTFSRTRERMSDGSAGEKKMYSDKYKNASKLEIGNNSNSFNVVTVTSRFPHFRSFYSPAFHSQADSLYASNLEFPSISKFYILKPVLNCICRVRNNLKQIES